MPAYVYAGGQYHLMAGQSIVKDGSLLTMKANDQIVFGHVAYDLGIVAPVEADVKHFNGEEPAGVKLYMTPEGAGARTGADWDNALSGQDFRQVVASGGCDCLYLQEGEYSLLFAESTESVPMGIYGGFPDHGTWDMRDAFAHPTRLKCQGLSGALFGDDVRGALDGLTVDAGFTAICQDAAKVPVLRNCSIDGQAVRGAEHSLVQRSRDMSGNYRSCLLADCDFRDDSEFASCILDDCMGDVNKLTDCKVINCLRDDYDHNGPYGFGFSSRLITGCLIANSRFFHYISADSFADCIMVNSDVSVSSDRGSKGPRVLSNCLAVNCQVAIESSNYGSDSNYYEGIRRIWCDDTARNFTVVRCKASGDWIFRMNTINCVAWKCQAKSEFVDSYYETIYNPAKPSDSRPIKVDFVKQNCVDSGRLGADNSIARFVFPGREAIGRVESSPCPRPSSPDYAGWLASFGDWHPAPGSRLIGNGTALPDVTTDLDGVTRPDPPTIGAYEPRPANP